MTLKMLLCMYFLSLKLFIIQCYELIQKRKIWHLFSIWPQTYKLPWHLRGSFWLFFHNLAPSQAPSNFTVIAQSSSSVLASWQLPPLKSRNGIITGFKLFYKRQDQFGEANITININSATTRGEIISRLEKYTEYVLQILAFTSAGDGPRSSKKVTRTKEGGKCWLCLVKLIGILRLIC